MSEINLKPCPFCGGEAKANNCGAGMYFIRCNTCGASMGDNFISKASAVERWNIRTIQLDDYIPVEAPPVQKIKNERGAGRKPKLNRNDIYNICGMHSRNRSMRDIAKVFKVSVGTVHEIINEQNPYDIFKASTEAVV